MISLDYVDQGTWEAMRERHRRQEFGCPECRSDVMFRAGELRRPHFAHKAVSDCPLSRESAELLEARAALYEWLRAKFKDAVSVEHRPRDVALPRPIDCWIARPGKAPIAYWIFDPNRKPADRHAILAAEKGSARWNFIFVARMHKPVPEEPGCLKLGTTEREFVRKTRYEGSYTSRRAGSLHYLDGRAKQLTTVRGVQLHEGPVHHGVAVVSPLAALTVHGDSGEFVHPGEYDNRRELLLRQRAEAEAVRVRAEEERHRREEAHRRAAEERRREGAVEEASGSSPSETRMRSPTGLPGSLWWPDDEDEWTKSTRVSWRDETWDPSRSGPSGEARPELPCEICGAMTLDEDQIVIDGARGTCKCRRCMYELH